MGDPWDLTEAQRMQFREAHGDAKRAAMATPDALPVAVCAAYGPSHDAQVWVPGAAGDAGRFCYPCIDRCHEALEFDHMCDVCRAPDEPPF